MRTALSIVGSSGLRAEAKWLSGEHPDDGPGGRGAQIPARPARAVAVTPVDVVHGVLDELGRRVAARDVDATLALWEPDGVLAGTMATNVGADEIRAYVSTVLAAEEPLSWEWDDVVAERQGDVIWFLAPGRIVFGERQAFRLTGVLRPFDGGWRFAQFHGSIPQ